VLSLFPYATTCNQSAGSATVSVSGGTASYTYRWNNGPTTSTTSGLGVGIYTVTITDSKGCTASTNTTISATGGPILTVSPTSVSCHGGSNGSATVSASGSG